MDKKLVDFLNKIKSIESSGGKDIDHPEMTSGIHKDQSAIGAYGLMPNTVQELVNRTKLQGPLDEDYQHLRNEDPEFVKAVLQARPDLQDRLAEQLGGLVLQRSGGDEEKAAYRWNMGHNTPSERITPEELNKSQYIKKFRSLKDKLNGK